nr:PIG-L family deacetylase [Planosporangium thailandense]
MQVVAHEDDDLLFMNPDIYNQINAGKCSVTVFVTDGRGEPTIRNRQRGIQDAYRLMANVSDLNNQDEWTGRLLTFGGKQVEEYVLRDRPNVKLVFMNLADNAPASGDVSIRSLWESGTAVTTTGIPCQDESGSSSCQSLVQQRFTYNHDGLLQTLAAVMGYYGPTTIRLQDTVPADPNRGYIEDHQDHVATAKFAEAATRRYGDASGTRANLVYYRDYNIQNVPENLVSWARDVKRNAFLNQYMPLNPPAQAYVNSGWTERMYYRWARGTSWVGRNADGRIQVFAVRDGEVFT